MILLDTTILDKIYSDLVDYRKSGDILFDNRDHGNFNGYDWPSTRDLLRRNDPIGLAECLMLSEMIEATIVGSKVELSRSLREPGFFDKIKAILDIHQKVMAAVATPLANMQQAFKLSLGPLLDDSEPKSREIACCLRDAIYAIDKGLKVRWLQCDISSPMPAHLQISEQIMAYDSIAAFSDALRQSLLPGAYLARIGGITQGWSTAIGIKAPGRIAYLSSLSIDVHTGQMKESAAPDTNMAERYDLDKIIFRYPDWLDLARIPKHYELKNNPWNHDNSVSIQDFSETNTSIRSTDEIDIKRENKSVVLGNIKILPRDRLVWLVMIVEMTCQAIQKIDSTTAISLSETLSNAMVCGNSNNLPVPYRSNWDIRPLTIAGGIKDLDLTPWEQDFLSPVFGQLTTEMLLPSGMHKIGIDPVSFESVRWPKDHCDKEYSFSRSEEIKHNYAQITPFSATITGTQEEIEHARNTIFLRNLKTVVMAWGNRRFDHLWEEKAKWFRAKLEPQIYRLTKTEHHCVTFRHQNQDGGCHAGNGVALYYTQSTKHKGYHPKCVHHSKIDATDMADIVPMNSGDLVDILGFKSEKDLPEFLRGWERKWESEKKGDWCFKKRERPGGKRYMEASVALCSLCIGTK